MSNQGSTQLNACKTELKNIIVGLELDRLKEAAEEAARAAARAAAARAAAARAAAQQASSAKTVNKGKERR